MDLEIIQIIITSVIALFAMLSFRYNIIHNKKINNLNKVNKALEKSIEDLSKHNPNYCYEINRHVKEFHLDSSGNAVIQSIWDGIIPLQNFTNLKIPYSFEAEGDGVKVSSPIVKELDNSDLPVVISDLKFRSNNKNYCNYSGNFTVLGHCIKSNSKIGFMNTQKVENGYSTSKGEAVKRYGKSDWNKEYCATKVMVPTNKLKITVIFPFEIKYLSGQPFPVCFINGTHTVHQSETEKIQKNFKNTFDKKAIVEIQDPTPGMTYAISWMPPDNTKMLII